MKKPKEIEEIQAAARERQSRFFANRIKLQIYMSTRLVQKLDKECELKQEGRGEVLRRLVDSLPD